MDIEHLVQAMSNNFLEDSQSAVSSEKVKPSNAPTSMATSSPTYEELFSSSNNLGEYNHY